MRKKLCHVFYDEYPKDSRIRRYTNLLLSEGFEVFIVCAGWKSEEEQKQNDPRLHLYRVPMTKRRSSFARRINEYMIFEVCSFFIVSWLFFTRGVRLFHVHTLPDFLVFSCIVPKAFGSRIILDFHELFPEFMMQHRPQLGYDSLSIRILLAQERWSFAFADEVIAFHDPAKEILQGRVRTHRNVTVVMNGVDETEMPPLTRTSDGKFVVVYNGTISFNLNLQIILRAMVLLRDRRPDVFRAMEFRLYGDGPETPSLIEMARQLDLRNMEYRGRLPFREMMKELSFASVCILPAKKDVYSELYYSLKLTEMIYLGIPVIATHLKTYVRYYPEDCILYFPSENLSELAERICYVHDHPRAVLKKTQRARNEYKKYHWNVMKQRYLALLANIMG
jgi:glycosyltransferase involved in cell wall biosynthesis